VSRGGAEEGGLAGVANASRFDISIEIGLEIVMRRHLMPLAAFLVQPAQPRRPITGSLLLAFALHFYSGQPLQNLSGVDT